MVQPEKGAAVPRFGVWDESDPQSAENFTHIFNKVREERNVGVGTAAGNNASATPNVRRVYPSNQNQPVYIRLRLLTYFDVYCLQASSHNVMLLSL